ncbi:hypothetical protein DIPPA_19887, partial [Diplonema papillatum]
GSSALWGCLRRLAAGVSTGERDAGRLSPGTKPAPEVPGSTPGDGPFRAGPAPATGGKPAPEPPSPGLASAGAAARPDLSFAADPFPRPASEGASG